MWLQSGCSPIGNDNCLTGSDKNAMASMMNISDKISFQFNSNDSIWIYIISKKVCPVFSMTVYCIRTVYSNFYRFHFSIFPNLLSRHKQICILSILKNVIFSSILSSRDTSNLLFNQPALDIQSRSSCSSAYLAPGGKCPVLLCIRVLPRPLLLRTLH